MLSRVAEAGDASRGVIPSVWAAAIAGDLASVLPDKVPSPKQNDATTVASPDVGRASVDARATASAAEEDVRGLLRGAVATATAGSAVVATATAPSNGVESLWPVTCIRSSPTVGCGTVLIAVAARVCTNVTSIGPNC